MHYQKLGLEPVNLSKYPFISLFINDMWTTHIFLTGILACSFGNAFIDEKQVDADLIPYYEDWHRQCNSMMMIGARDTSCVPGCLVKLFLCAMVSMKINSEASESGFSGERNLHEIMWVRTKCVYKADPENFFFI
ncbi:hypothetical protein JTB14_038386 [Gonioctena quinquepunctata]|nr:hypothetical protein JTB14_038386 [Gonioctena quinquepunctata]